MNKISKDINEEETWGSLEQAAPQLAYYNLKPQNKTGGGVMPNRECESSTVLVRSTKNIIARLNVVPAPHT